MSLSEGLTVPDTVSVFEVSFVAASEEAVAGEGAVLFGVFALAVAGWAFISQWNGSKLEFGSTQDGFLAAYMMNGATTTMMAPIINTENQTVLLPVDIWLGGMKLRMKASNEPQNPRPPTNHIRPLPDLPIRNGRLSFFIL